MNAMTTKKPVLENATTDVRDAKPYEAPRISRKRSLERVTLASGAGFLQPGGIIGGQ